MKTSTRLVLWVPYTPLSPNQTRYLHWTRARKHVEASKDAWLSSLRSCPSAITSLMTIISAVHSKEPATLFRAQSGLMTETDGSHGNMPKSEVLVNPESWLRL